MASAVFTSGLTYTPGGGGTLNQGFRVAFNYTAVSAGKHDVAIGSTSAVAIAFGGVGNALGVLVQNNIDVDLTVTINGSAALYRLAPGGMLMHWAPAAPGGTPLTAIAVTPAGSGPSVAGSVDYVILGN